MTKIKYILITFFCLAIITLTSNMNFNEAYAQVYDRRTPVVIAVEKVSPAVVNISMEYTVTTNSNPFSGFGGSNSFFFNNFFNDIFENGFKRKYKGSSIGSGVIIDGKRGYILTNSHVISKSGKITVTLKNKNEFEAKVIGVDPDSDLAVLRIESKGTLPSIMPSITMGTSDNLMIGETVIAIGNPFGFSHTVTTGVISSLNRSIKTEDRVFQNFIQTDASINPGNSGGPLLNINGELIGINTAIYEKAQGIGFAIPINKAKKIVSNLILYGEVIPAWTGLIVQDIDESVGGYLELPKNTKNNNIGVMVKVVEKKSPASKTDINEEDIITKVDDKEIGSTADFISCIKEHSAGDNIKLEILKNKKRKTVLIKTEVFPESLAPELAYDLLGVKVQDRKNLKGVEIVKVSSNSYLAKIGVKTGDIIRQIDDTTINNQKAFNKAIIKYRMKQAVVVLIQRNSQIYYVTIELMRG